MLKARTLKILALVLVLYGAACLPAALELPFLERASTWFILAPFFTSHVLHELGVPGLLDHAGRCGWGWCAPTTLGWALTGLIWLGVTWVLAWGIGLALNRYSR